MNITSIVEQQLPIELCSVANSPLASAMTKIFFTGATGFVGGQALHEIYNAAHAHFEIAVLNRHIDSEAKILRAYPKVRIVRGDLDAVELIESEAQNADVVFHLASTKHLASSQAIANGLSDVRRSKPGFWVQMSGASMFSVPDITNGTYGEPPSVVHDDLQGTGQIISLIRNNPARTVDNLVLDQDSSKVKTALIVGPLIYGTGEGPGNTRSIQVPEMTRVTLEKGKGFHVGAGKSVWNTIHVRDLGAVFCKLAHAADDGQPDIWNENGVYCVESGKKAFGDIAELVAKEAHAQGLIKSADVKVSLSADEANAAMPGGAILWATNAVSVGSRARKQLSWQPGHESLEATIPEVVKLEA